MRSYTHKVANGNHIVTTDSVTSIHLTYRLTKSVSVEAVGYEQLAQSRYAVLRSHALATMDRTRDLLMTSPTPNLCSTTPTRPGRGDAAE